VVPGSAAFHDEYLSLQTPQGSNHGLPTITRFPSTPVIPHLLVKSISSQKGFNTGPSSFSFSPWHHPVSGSQVYSFWRETLGRPTVSGVGVKYLHISHD